MADVRPDRVLWPDTNRLFEAHTSLVCPADAPELLCVLASFAESAGMIVEWGWLEGAHHCFCSSKTYPQNACIKMQLLAEEPILRLSSYGSTGLMLVDLTEPDACDKIITFFRPRIGWKS